MLFPGPDPLQHAGSFRWEREDSKRQLRVACVLAILAIVAFSADLPIHRFCEAGRLPGDLRRLLSWSEIFAHGIGVAILAFTMLLLDPTHRRHVPRVVASALGSGLVADVIKLSVVRVRPNFFSADSVRDSFVGWCPAAWPIEGFARFDHRLQSFPSAHAAVAAGFAMGLAAVYPRGRYLFLLFAVLAAGQRIESGAHFLSDTCAGAAIGCVVASLLAGPNWLGQIFDRIEKSPEQ